MISDIRHETMGVLDSKFVHVSFITNALILSYTTFGPDTTFLKNAMTNPQSPVIVVQSVLRSGAQFQPAVEGVAGWTGNYLLWAGTTRTALACSVEIW